MWSIKYSISTLLIKLLAEIEKNWLRVGRDIRPDEKPRTREKMKKGPSSVVKKCYLELGAPPK